MNEPAAILNLIEKSLWWHHSCTPPRIPESKETLIKICNLMERFINNKDFSDTVYFSSINLLFGQSVSLMKFLEVLVEDFVSESFHRLEQDYWSVELRWELLIALKCQARYLDLTGPSL